MRYFYLIITFLFMECSGTKYVNSLPNIPPIMDLSKAFDIQGHRGCRGLMPENTVPAMIMAMERGVTTLEMDIVFTKDKKAILSHEPFFNHEITTKPDGSLVTVEEERSLNIYKMDYAETQLYDVGLKPHPRFPKQEKLKATKPLLSEIIDIVKNYSTPNGRMHFPYLNIETKTQPATDNIYHPAPEEFVDLLMAVIREKKIEPYVIIQSFDFRTLQYLHKKYPSIRTAMLIEDFDKTSFEDQLKKLGFTASIYSPNYLLVNEELVKKCHEKEMKIIPWTVNDQTLIKKFRAMGVDGIITDYPDLFNY